MISSRSDLASALNIELKQYECGILKYFPLGISETQILRSHIKLLRKTEFYYNTNKRFLYYISAIRLHLLQNKYGIHIPINTCDVGLSIAHVGPIVINSKAKIGKNCRIHVGVNIGEGSRGATIGDNVFLGPGC